MLLSLLNKEKILNVYATDRLFFPVSNFLAFNPDSFDLSVFKAYILLSGDKPPVHKMTPSQLCDWQHYAWNLISLNPGNEILYEDIKN